MAEKIRINRQIHAKELRVIDSEGENKGVMPFEQALALAEAKGLDLIEISPGATPPIAKVMDFGKFQYEQNKKQKEIKAKAHTSELKNVQVKIGTGEHDLVIKARNVSLWLKEGHRIKVDLFLTGRSKYMEESFLKERLGRLLRLLSENYRIAEDYKRGPKGLSVLIERAK